ncbi:MAG TPA: hypothetical protein VE988_23125 [Gemmataceae bacterium]|nr:hypothetical protein [Gemmataceae bacterium]
MTAILPPSMMCLSSIHQHALVFGEVGLDAPAKPASTAKERPKKTADERTFTLWNQSGFPVPLAKNHLGCKRCFGAKPFATNAAGNWRGSFCATKKR